MDLMHRLNGMCVPLKMAHMILFLLSKLLDQLLNQGFSQ